MAIILTMPSDPNAEAQAAPPAAGPASQQDEPSAREGAESGSERSAAEDLAAGLDLMLRAAKKALKNIEPTHLEELGKRAMRTVENLDRKKVSDFGKKAAKNLDPRKIEEVAEEAGKELMSVIERVAERVEGLIGHKSSPPKSGRAEDGAEEAPRVRVDSGGSSGPN